MPQISTGNDADHFRRYPVHFYTFFTPQPRIFTSTLHAARNNSVTEKRLWRCVVSVAVITGIVLVCLLLGYLVYALIRAEEF